MTSKRIKAQVDQAVYEIYLSRADKLNALTDAMYGSLVEHINQAQQDDSIKVVFLRSDSKHFCAGNDLADFLECNFNENSNVILFLRAIVQLTKPLVCAVGGAAVGIGTTMLLHSDLVFAAQDCKFSVPFIKLGLTPEGGSSKLLAQRCGSAKANDWLFTGRTFLAQEALQAGLVTQVLPDIDATWAEAHKQAHKLANNSLRVLQDTKALLKGDQVENVLQLIDKEAKVFAKGLQTDEAKAAFKAFLSH